MAGPSRSAPEARPLNPSQQVVHGLNEEFAARSEMYSDDVQFIQVGYCIGLHTVVKPLLSHSTTIEFSNSPSQIFAGATCPCHRALLANRVSLVVLWNRLFL